jgi:hypothetical protein
MSVLVFSVSQSLLTVFTVRGPGRLPKAGVSDEATAAATVVLNALRSTVNIFF